MRKIFFSLITIGLLLLAACENEIKEPTGFGTLEAKVSFPNQNDLDIPTPQAAALRATSNAVPTVSWANVNKVQLFLYNKVTGQVAFSRTVDPSATPAQQSFKWTNVPAGTYRLALLANVKSNSDNIATTIGSTMTVGEFDDNNVVGNMLNSTLKIDLKRQALPGLGTGSYADYWGNSREGYAPPSEIFTAYCANDADVIIAAGQDVVLSEVLTLRREISMLRVRINPNQLPELSKVIFNSSTSFIAAQRLPEGFGLKVGSFAGGIFENPGSDVNRVMVGPSGVNTYKTQNPASGYSPNQVIGFNDGFDMWNDVFILPNASEAERAAGNISNDDNVPIERQYFIIISARVQDGYKYTNDPDTGAERYANGESPVFWYGNVRGVFTKNVIREVNMRLITAGDPGIPPQPTEEGTLEISIGTPEPWNSQIVETPMDV